MIIVSLFVIKLIQLFLLPFPVINFILLLFVYTLGSHYYYYYYYYYYYFLVDNSFQVVKIGSSKKKENELIGQFET